MYALLKYLSAVKTMMKYKAGACAVALGPRTEHILRKYLFYTPRGATKKIIGCEWRMA